MTDYTVRRLLDTFVSKGAPDLRAAVKVTPATAPRQIQPRAEELEKLTACPNLPLRFLILACAEAGLRSGTALTVRPADIADGLIVTRTKKGAVTHTPVSPRLGAVLGTINASADITRPVMELLEGHPWKFPARELQKRWARWKAQCGVRKELRLHDLRRGLARRLYKVTGDVRAVQSLLSHRSMASTLWYLDERNPAVSAADLNAALLTEKLQ